MKVLPALAAVTPSELLAMVQPEMMMSEPLVDVWIAATIGSRFEAGTVVPKVRKELEGKTVRLGGLIVTHEAPLGETMFTIPEGFWPLIPIRFPMVRTNGSSYPVEITTAGVAKAGLGSIKTSEELSLEPINWSLT